MPGTEEEASLFWSLAAHRHLRGEPDRCSAVIPDLAPPAKDIEDLMRMLIRRVETGDPEAIRRYFVLIKSADGDGAEWLEEETIRLLIRSPGPILKRWKVLGDAGLLPGLIGATCNDDEIRQAMTEVGKHQGWYPEAVRDLLVRLAGGLQQAEGVH